jgi:hypothetical protein
MATTIVTKNGSGAPTDSDLVAGELAVDLTNGRLYTTDLDSGGTVLELGTNPASDVTFGDNTKAVFGAGSDLQIYHDASDSIINDNGTGSLKLQQGGSTKLEVTTTGIDVTGTVTADGLTVGGTGTGDADVVLKRSSDGLTVGNLTVDSANSRLVLDTAYSFLDFETESSKRGMRINNCDIQFFEDTGTTAKFYWDASAESLGIGTTAPTDAITILDSTNSTAGQRIKIGYESSDFNYTIGRNTSTGHLDFIGTNSAGSSLIGYTFNGNVGIGNGGLALTRLAVTNSVVGANIETTSSDAGHEALIVNRQNSDGVAIAINKAGTTVGSIGSYVGTHLRVGSGEANLLFATPNVLPATSTGLNSDGVIDLGATDRRFKDLYLSGAVIIDADGATGNAWTHFKNDDQTWLVGCRGTDGDSFTIYDLTADVPRVKVDTSGNLLVGTTTAEARLTVKSSGSSSSTNAINVDNSSGTELFYVRDDGALRTGSAAVSPYNNTAAVTANLFVNTDGTLLRATSSRRYKKDIVDARFGLSDLLNLRPVNYKGINSEVDGDIVYGGLIAEEVHDAGLTEFVEYNKENQPDALRYQHMVSLCIKAIQEQQTTIEALTARIAALES